MILLPSLRSLLCVPVSVGGGATPDEFQGHDIQISRRRAAELEFYWTGNAPGHW
jgi:hypothetical protein